MNYSRQLLFAFLTASFAITGCSSEHTVVAKAPEIVRGLTVVSVEDRKVQDVFESIGTVRASRTADISAEVTGRLVGVNVREGDKVKQNQELARIEESQPHAAVEQADAALSAADHELSAAESDLSLAKSTFTRVKKLYDEKSVSPQEYDEINARLASTTARRDSAAATRAQALSALQQARITLDRTRIRAPFDGLVTARRVDPGVLAAPGLALLTLESTGRYRLEAVVPESDLKFVRSGAAVPVALDALDGKPLFGRVVEIVPAADPSSRSFVVKIELPTTADLRSGLFGRAQFTRGQKQAITVPSSAVLQHGQLESVYVLDENSVATLRYVTLGRSQNDQVEVLSGLAPGDRVVSNPTGREIAGKQVEVR